MKIISISILFLLFQVSCLEKKKDKINDIHSTTNTSSQNLFDSVIFQNDISKIFFPDSLYTGMETIKHQEPLGFLGENYQRFEIHFINCIKSKTDHTLYEVTGKTRVENTIHNFTGQIKIQSVKFYKDSIWLMDELDPAKDKSAVDITSEIKLDITHDELKIGCIIGQFKTSAYKDSSNQIHYNAFGFFADGYSNNQFQGNWINHQTKEKKTCNWGDYRIPNAGDLDMGAGEFSPSEKYSKYGWKIFSDSWSQDEKIANKALLELNKEWWK